MRFLLAPSCSFQLVSPHSGFQEFHLPWSTCHHNLPLLSILYGCLLTQCHSLVSVTVYNIPFTKTSIIILGNFKSLRWYTNTTISQFDLLKKHSYFCFLKRYSQKRTTSFLYSQFQTTSIYTPKNSFYLVKMEVSLFIPKATLSTFSLHSSLVSSQRSALQISPLFITPSIFPSPGSF